MLRSWHVFLENKARIGCVCGHVGFGRSGRSPSTPTHQWTYLTASVESMRPPLQPPFPLPTPTPDALATGMFIRTTARGCSASEITTWLAYRENTGPCFSVVQSRQAGGSGSSILWSSKGLGRLPFCKSFGSIQLLTLLSIQNLA